MTSTRYSPRSFNNLITGARDRSNSMLQPFSKSGRVITKSTSWTDPYIKQQTKKKKNRKKKKKKNRKNKRRNRRKRKNRKKNKEEERNRE